MTRPSLGFAVFLLGAGLASAQPAGQIVVLESSTPRYIAGQSIDAAQAITLNAGETLMIATEDARLVRLAGPYSGPPIGAAPDDNAARRALAQLLAADRPEVGGIGGVRGDDRDESPTDTRPGPWFVHTARSGDQCVLQGQAALLWREAAQTAATIEIRVSLGEAAAEVR